MRRVALVVVVVTFLAALITSPSGGPIPGRVATAAEARHPASLYGKKLLTHGVTRRTIKIGLHAPLTGAAPLPSDSIERGKDLYFRWRAAKGHRIHRRTVEVVLRNDQYNPSTAVSVCKEMVEKEHVFLLIGITGVDQMQACARYAASVNVPYISPGSTGVALKQLPSYFATSMAWRHQGRLLADYLLDRKGARRRNTGALWMDSPNYRPALARFRDVMERRRGKLVYERTVSRGAGAAEARAVVTEMDLAGVQNVAYLHSPVWFLQVLQQARSQGFDALWTSLGPVIALDSVARIACDQDPNVRITTLSPWPAFADRNRFDPRFDRAVERFHPAFDGDDVMWQLWAQSIVLEEMLDTAGRRLTRQRFIRRVERATIRTGVLPTLRYSPQDHFGAAATHLLKLSCADRRWHTIRSFVRDF